MAQKVKTTMTAKEFAEKMEVNYRTVLNWLKAGIVPGAKLKESPIGNYYEIPISALNMNPPTAGRGKKLYNQ
jgi:hypothetical protein